MSYKVYIISKLYYLPIMFYLRIICLKWGMKTMIIVDDKALNYAKSKSLCFVTGIAIKSIPCN